MIEFSKEEKAILVEKIQTYLDDELGMEIGQFDAEFLLDFMANNLGNYFYNRGLDDAQAILEGRLDAITEAIAELEKAVD